MVKTGEAEGERENEPATFADLVRKVYQSRGFEITEVPAPGPFENPWVCNRDDERIIVSIWTDPIRNAGIPAVRAAAKPLVPQQADAAHFVVVGKVQPGAATWARNRGVVLVRPEDLRTLLSPADQQILDRLLK